MLALSLVFALAKTGRPAFSTAPARHERGRKTSFECVIVNETRSSAEAVFCVRQRTVFRGWLKGRPCMWRESGFGTGENRVWFRGCFEGITRIACGIKGVTSGWNFATFVGAPPRGQWKIDILIFFFSLVRRGFFLFVGSSELKKLVRIKQDYGEKRVRVEFLPKILLFLPSIPCWIGEPLPPFWNRCQQERGVGRSVVRRRGEREELCGAGSSSSSRQEP